MNGEGRARLYRYILIGTTCALPCVLVFSSFRTFQELEEQKKVYLRERVAQIAAKLETLPAVTDPKSVASLQSSEPHLRSLNVLSRDSAAGSAAALQPIWEGYELYRTENAYSNGQQVFRAYLPFHTAEGLRIAAIDLDSDAADFLLVHARHNIMTAFAGGLALVLLSMYAIWLARRSAALEGRQAELEHMARLGRLSAVLAHEIRNPLGTIKGFTQLAVEHSKDISATLLEPVLTETARLEKLVNDLLAYGRPPTPDIRTVEWPEIATELQRFADTYATPHPVRFAVDTPHVRFDTDPNLLKQILLNLLKNAFEAVASATDAEVAVSVRQAGPERLEIVVSDNGSGLGAAADKLFEPFFTTKASGSGLGLPISRQLARSLEGDLELRSRIPRGVESVLSLRMAPAAIAAVATA